MGMFSWLDCQNTKRAILDDVKRDSYVLVPKEFVEKYGERIKEPCYEGYGRFGGYDVYELVAIWNRDHIGIENESKPERDRWEDNEEGQKYYELAVARYENACQKIKDFTTLSLDEMVEKYGDYHRSDNDWLRIIGIDIACYDNASLKYPIKITYDEKAIYEDCEPSPNDPNQGWGYYVESADSDVQYMSYDELKEAYEETGDYNIMEYMMDEYGEDYDTEEDYQDYEAD